MINFTLKAETIENLKEFSEMLNKDINQIIDLLLYKDTPSTLHICS